MLQSSSMDTTIFGVATFIGGYACVDVCALPLQLPRSRFWFCVISCWGMLSGTLPRGDGHSRALF